MASNRRTNAQKKQDISDDIDNFPEASQGSNGSDDANMEAIIKQMHVSMDKKKKEKETKFLQLSKKEIDKRFTEKARVVQDGVKEIDNATQYFHQKYAECQDTIRDLWIQIQDEQQKLAVAAANLRKANANFAKKTERLQIIAMSRAKLAAEDFRHIIASLDV
ncbi:hypothetical protein PLICRDRAFT_37074 [Plicaturopsis crispa FD-325 SS-3]|nr:hypothetical protein PLICRDRAFT_37074 [Plicaturopsis crispa FD-325 SS-3]